MSDFMIPTRSNRATNDVQNQKGETTHCSLDQVAQPRYFAGQLLTDEDLTAQTNWAQQKFRLGRFVDGWGVVCGLQVHCDPQDPTNIIIEPGYAKDGCGDDIIICDPYPVSLQDACKPIQDPCTEIYIVTSQATAANKQDVDASTEDHACVDLYIRYATEAYKPVSSLLRGENDRTDQCENSRIRESFSIGWESVAADSVDPVTATARRWVERFEVCHDLLKDALDLFPSTERLAQSTPVTRKQQFIHWIERQSGYQFCGLKDAACQLQDSQFAIVEAGRLNEEVARILFLVIQDCRNKLLQQSCGSASTQPGVPLGRVWLKEVLDEERDLTVCHVVAVDTYEPYRRMLAQEKLPAPPGSINFGQFIWDREEVACAKLNALGITTSYSIQKNFAEALAYLMDQASSYDADPLQGHFLRCDERYVQLVVVDMNEMGMGMRVIGYDHGGYRLGEGSEDAFDAAEDELTEIDGIATERASKLREQGIRSFEALANLEYAKLKEIFPRMGKKSLEQWQQQARIKAEEKKG